MWCTYTVEYYSAVKKNEILPFVITQMDLEGIMLSVVSQRKTNSVWFHLYVESKKQMNKYTENKRVIASGEMGGEGEKQVREIKR